MAAIVRLMLGEPRWLQGSLGVVFSGVTFCQGAQPHLAALSIPNLLRSSLLTAANSFKGGIRVARACFLAPDIVKAIFDGKQPAALRSRKIERGELPLCWEAQRAMLGFS